MKKVTLLIPCYNEEASLPTLYGELVGLAERQKDYAWQMLFVDDGSYDRTPEILRTLRREDPRVCIVQLSRNFGKEAAMLAGFDHATGDCTVILDADLQHPPSLIPEMLSWWEKGFEDVFAKRRTRGKESWLRKKLSQSYYKLLQRSARVEVLENVGDFRLLDRKCVDVLKQLRESERYTKGMFCWIGFRKKELLFEQGDRVAGKSSWNFRSLFGLAMEGITSFTIAPLRMATLMGFLISAVALVYMGFIIFKTLIWGEVVQGFPTLMTAVLLLGGVQLIALGIIGEYVGRIFNETKRRPVYAVEEYLGEEQP